MKTLNSKMKTLSAIVGLSLGVLFSTSALSQSPVTTQPRGVTTLNSSSSIAVTNTFQSVFAESTNTPGRLNCTVQNTGSNDMYVFFGPIASATIAKSVKLASGQSVTCSIFGIVLKDQVSVTGTMGDTFYAAQQ